MKKSLAIVVLFIVGLTVLANAGIFESLMLFILAGIIPGTTYVVPPTFMLLLMTSITWLVVFNLLWAELPQVKSTKKKPSKKHLPKQRYKEV